MYAHGVGEDRAGSLLTECGMVLYRSLVMLCRICRNTITSRNILHIAHRYLPVHRTIKKTPDLIN